jgi:uncharacterized LabA/DUF88 family protein
MAQNRQSVLIIDGYYLKKASKNKWDAKKIGPYIEKLTNTKLLFKYFVDSLPTPPTQGHKNLLLVLKNEGFECPEQKYKQETRNVICHNCQNKFSHQIVKQAGVDVFIACELIDASYNDNIICVILIAGDGDFLPAVDKIRNRNKEVWLLSSKVSYNKTLRSKVGARFVFLEDCWDNFNLDNKQDAKSDHKHETLEEIPILWQECWDENNLSHYYYYIPGNKDSQWEIPSENFNPCPDINCKSVHTNKINNTVQPKQIKDDVRKYYLSEINKYSHNYLQKSIINANNTDTSQNIKNSSKCKHINCKCNIFVSDKYNANICNRCRHSKLEHI